jgi:lipid-A-disaccharide synthase-like uncharacterized protein
MTWRTEYNVNARLNQAQAARNWFWLGIWAVGQALFFLRFLIQWLATEIKKKSIVPAAFWYFSVCAALLQSASFLQRADWVNAIGMTATIFIYLRNIWFIHFAQNEKNVAQETA